MERAEDVEVARAAHAGHHRPALAAEWFERFEGAGLDGVVAKPLDGEYREGQRTMQKVKHQRTADCAIGGYREHKEGGVGSLLLGLFDADGVLHHVGVASSFAAPLRKQLLEELAPYRKRALDEHPWRGWAEADAGESGQRRPGAQSRWTGGKDLSWEPVRVELVAEVAYEHLQGDRFRHTALRALASRPRTGIVHLCAARRAGPDGAARDLRPRRGAWIVTESGPTASVLAGQLGYLFEDDASLRDASVEKLRDLLNHKDRYARAISKYPLENDEEIARRVDEFDERISAADVEAARGVWRERE